MMDTLLKAKRRGHRRGPGVGIPEAAIALNIPEKVLRRAIELGEIECHAFGGTKRIPRREIERILRVFGE